MQSNKTCYQDLVLEFVSEERGTLWTQTAYRVTTSVSVSVTNVVRTFSSLGAAGDATETAARHASQPVSETVRVQLNNGASKGESQRVSVEAV